MQASARINTTSKQMNTFLKLIYFCILTCCSAGSAQVLKAESKVAKPTISHTFSGNNNRDSSIVVIPFEYKQSALYHSFTLEVMDSVVAILFKYPLVTISIEGYTHMDEGSDTISYYLSLNRALFIRDYVIGRGIDSGRIISVKGFGKARPLYHGVNKEGIVRNCRAEIRLNYPLPAPKAVIADKDEDGIPDSEDSCPEVFGEVNFKGCPNKDAIVVPFESQSAFLNSINFTILDSVVNILKRNPTLTIAIEGHAYKTEGIKSVCDIVSKERAEVVKGYLLSRYIAAVRIESMKACSNQRPLNAGKNPREILANSRAEVIIIHH